MTNSCTSWAAWTSCRLFCEFISFRFVCEFFTSSLRAFCGLFAGSFASCRKHSANVRCCPHHRFLVSAIFAFIRKIIVFIFKCFLVFRNILKILRLIFERQLKDVRMLEKPFEKLFEQLFETVRKMLEIAQICLNVPANLGVEQFSLRRIIIHIASHSD